MPSRRWKRLRDALSHVGLLLTLAAYTAVGGLVFRAIEGPAEAGRLRALQVAVLEGRRGLVVATLAAVGNASSEAAVQEALQRGLREYEALIHEASRGGVEVPALTNDPYAATATRWTLEQGMFFAVTVLTTIGYGNIAPVTLWGRAFCLLFALVGIPLTLSVIADLGVLLASAVSALPCWTRCRTWWTLDERAGSLGNALLALGAVLLLSVYLAAGAALFTLWEEGWDFFDGFYFCFITMTTIGFGDLVPRHPSYSLLCSLYILVGLAMTSAIIELVRRQYASSWRRLQEALSGPALSEALRRLGTVPDMKGIPRGILAAVSLARLVPQGSERGPASLKEASVWEKNALDVAADPETASTPSADPHKVWEEALAVVLREMEEKARKERLLQMQRQKEKEQIKRRREREKQIRKAKREGKVIEFIIYETTV